MQDLERRPSVSTVPADQYQYGFMSNSPEILRSLGRRSHAKAIATHPRELRRAMLRGLTNQLRVDGRLQPGCYGVQSQDDDCIREMYGPAQGYSGKYKDDLTGQVLKDSLVMEARKKELDFFKSNGGLAEGPKTTGLPAHRTTTHQRTMGGRQQERRS